MIADPNKQIDPNEGQPAKGTLAWAEEKNGWDDNTPAAPAPAVQPAGTSSTGTPVKASGTTPLQTNIPAEYTASSYDELIPQLEKRMAEYKPLSEEDLKKLRRRQKAEGIISGISDAVQSVANLIFTNKYAPNMYNGKEGMSAKAKERWDKEKAQREADADKYLKYALTIGKMKDADKQRGLEAWKTERDLARKDRAQAIADAKEKRAQAIHELNVDLINNKIDAAEADARLKKIEADYAEEFEIAKIGTEKARGAAQKAAASASNARARYYNNGGSGKKAEFVAYDKDGNAHYYTDHKAAEQFARRNGTWVDENGTESSTVEEKAGNTVLGEKTTTTTKNRGGYSKKPYNPNKYKRNNKQGGGTTPPPLS